VDLNAAARINPTQYGGWKKPLTSASTIFENERKIKLPDAKVRKEAEIQRLERVIAKHYGEHGA
jgi:hypothetical protein